MFVGWGRNMAADMSEVYSPGVDEQCETVGEYCK